MQRPYRASRGGNVFTSRITRCTTLSELAAVVRTDGGAYNHIAFSAAMLKLAKIAGPACASSGPADGSSAATAGLEPWQLWRPAKGSSAAARPAITLRPDRLGGPIAGGPTEIGGTSGSAYVTAARVSVKQNRTDPPAVQLLSLLLSTPVALPVLASRLNSAVRTPTVQPQPVPATDPQQPPAVTEPPISAGTSLPPAAESSAPTSSPPLEVLLAAPASGAMQDGGNVAIRGAQWETFDLQGLSNTMYALAVLQHRDEGLMAELLDATQFRLDSGIPQVHECSGWLCASGLLGFGLQHGWPPAEQVHAHISTSQVDGHAGLRPSQEVPSLGPAAGRGHSHGLLAVLLGPGIGLFSVLQTVQTAFIDCWHA